jgi:SAM-dependent methyltransferase
MDRREWLLERRAAVEAAYDAEARTYDEHRYPVDTQHRFVERLVAACPPDGIVLDAPCGTGQYFPLVGSAGLRVVGIDQSAGMLEQARAREIAVALYHVSLRELPFQGEFDAVMTVDALENVFPEDWPLVIANLHRAVCPGGHLYPVDESPAPGSRAAPSTDLEIPVEHAALLLGGSGPSGGAIPTQLPRRGAGGVHSMDSGSTVRL